jgi:hypothetical protein
MAVITEQYPERGLGAGRNGSLSDTTVREGTVAGDEVEVTARLRRRLEEEYGMREAAYLMERPAGGWDSLATKEYIDLRIERLRAEFRDQTTRLLRWIVPTIFAGMAALGAIAGAVGGIIVAAR